MKKKINELLKTARKATKSRHEAVKAAVFSRMSTEQLQELAEGNPSEERIREILASVNGLWLLEEGG